MNNTISARPSAPTTRDRLKVLLLDDDDIHLGLLIATLRDLGVWNTKSFTSGDKALMAQDHPIIRFDLIVLDLHMPVMDGFQFMAAVAETGFAGGLIIVSGQNKDVMRAASLVAQLQRFTLLGAITKPAAREALNALIPAQALAKTSTQY